MSIHLAVLCFSVKTVILGASKCESCNYNMEKEKKIDGNKLKNHLTAVGIITNVSWQLNIMHPNFFNISLCNFHSTFSVCLLCRPWKTKEIYCSSLMK